MVRRCRPANDAASLTDILRPYRSRARARTYLTRVQSAAPESGAQHVARVPGLGQLGHLGAFVLAPHGHGGVPQAQRRAADLAQLAPSRHGAQCPAVVASCTAPHAQVRAEEASPDPGLASTKSHVYIYCTRYVTTPCCWSQPSCTRFDDTRFREKNYNPRRWRTRVAHHPPYKPPARQYS